MLHLRQKWRQEQRDITVGDTVLVVANDTPRGKWPMARVTNVYPGKDGHVRVCQEKPQQGILLRSLNKLCLLEESE